MKQPNHKTLLKEFSKNIRSECRASIDWENYDVQQAIAIAEDRFALFLEEKYLPLFH